MRTLCSGSSFRLQSSVGDGILRGEARGNGVELGLRLRHGDTGLEQTDGTQEMGAAGLHPWIQIGSGKPEVGLGEDWDVSGQDTDDGARFAVERNGLADHVGIAAKTVLPQMVAEDYDFGVGGFFV